MIDFVCLYTTNVKLSIHQALQGSGIFAPSLQTLTNGMKFLLGTLVLAPWPILVVTFIPFCQDKPFSHAILCVVEQQSSQNFFQSSVRSCSTCSHVLHFSQLNKMVENYPKNLILITFLRLTIFKIKMV